MLENYRLRNAINIELSGKNEKVFKYSSRQFSKRNDNKYVIKSFCWEFPKTSGSRHLLLHLCRRSTHWYLKWVDMRNRSEMVLEWSDFSFLLIGSLDEKESENRKCSKLVKNHPINQFWHEKSTWNGFRMIRLLFLAHRFPWWVSPLLESPHYTHLSTSNFYHSYKNSEYH